jgi:hypothetical protein
MPTPEKPYDPDDPIEVGQSYLPQRYPWQIMPLSRFFWGLFLHPRRENWLLVGLLIGAIAFLFAVLAAASVLQTFGIGGPALIAGGAVAGLAALEYLMYRLYIRFTRPKSTHGRKSR